MYIHTSVPISQFILPPPLTPLVSTEYTFCESGDWGIHCYDSSAKSSAWNMESDGWRPGYSSGLLYLTACLDFLFFCYSSVDWASYSMDSHLNSWMATNSCSPCLLSLPWKPLRALPGGKCQPSQWVLSVCTLGCVFLWPGWLIYECDCISLLSSKNLCPIDCFLLQSIMDNLFCIIYFIISVGFCEERCMYVFHQILWAMSSWLIAF